VFCSSFLQSFSVWALSQYLHFISCHLFSWKKMIRDGFDNCGCNSCINCKGTMVQGRRVQRTVWTNTIIFNYAVPVPDSAFPRHRFSYGVGKPSHPLYGVLPDLFYFLCLLRIINQSIKKLKKLYRVPTYHLFHKIMVSFSRQIQDARKPHRALGASEAQPYLLPMMRPPSPSEKDLCPAMCKIPFHSRIKSSF